MADEEESGQTNIGPDGTSEPSPDELLPHSPVPTDVQVSTSTKESVETFSGHVPTVGLDAFGPTNEPEMVTILQAVQATGTYEKFIRRAVQSGKVRARRLDNNRILVNLADVRTAVGHTRPDNDRTVVNDQLMVLIDDWRRQETQLRNQIQGLIEGKANAEARATVFQERHKDKDQTIVEKDQKIVELEVEIATLKKRRHWWQRGRG